MATRKPSSSADEAGSSGPSAATRILILHGKDRFLQDEHLHRLIDALTKKHGEGGTDTVRFDGQRGPSILADVLDECRSFGLMQQHKIVLIDNTDLLLKGEDDEGAAPAPAKIGKGGKRGPIPHTPRELLENYAADPSATATLVLRASTWRPGNLDKAVAKVGAVIKCDPMGEPEAIRWAQARAKEHHRTSIDARGAAALVNAVGTELGRIDTELEKLALAAGGEGAPITIDLIETMVGVTRHEEFWAIQAALVTGGGRVPAAGLAQLHDLIEVSRHDPVPISYAYMEMGRKIHVAARGLAQGASQGQIMGALKIWGPDRDAMTTSVMNAARAAGPTVAARLFNQTIATDAANKSGGGDPVRNLEILTVRFSQATNRGGQSPNRR